MITDDELLLYYYRDGLDAAERARIGAALAEQPELARRLHALVARLDTASAMPEVPVPAHTQERWKAALARAATETRVAPIGRRSFVSPPWLAMAAAVAVVAIIFAIRGGMQSTTQPVPERMTAQTQPAGTNDAPALENGLKWHLASTERQLASLGDVTPEERARLIETIISQNRMYALAAERADEPQLARVLRAFTPVLENLADGNSETTASSISQLNFELRVMQARLGADVPANVL